MCGSSWYARSGVSDVAECSGRLGFYAIDTSRHGVASQKTWDFFSYRMCYEILQ